MPAYAFAHSDNSPSLYVIWLTYCLLKLCLPDRLGACATISYKAYATSRRNEMHRFHSVTALAVIVAGAAGVTCAQATIRVGGAAAIESNVSGSLPGQSPSRKAKGDDVYENELIRTQTNSTAQII